MRSKSEACQAMGLNPNLPTVMITGGSQGAGPINAHIRKNLDKYRGKGLQLIWQCGMRDYDELKAAVTDDTVQLHKFISNMGMAYSAADVVISRSGAIALAELMICAKPSILIPYTLAAGDHQMINARALAERQAAMVIPQTNLPKGELETVLFDLLDNPAKLAELGENAGQMARPEAAESIANEVIALVA